MTSGVRGLFGALLISAAAVFTLIAGGGSSEGTVIAKIDQGVYHHACQVGGTPAGPVAVPIWGSCAVPECWRLVVRHSEDDTVKPCVNREEYDQAQIGTFWRGRTDR
jgi:hypothetical protein